MTTGSDSLKTAERLAQAEAALRKCERLSIANSFAGAVMHEVNNPLAAITNLVFLTSLQADNPDAVRENMAIIDRQLRTLATVTSQVLSFQREQSAARDFDLIELIEAALKLHRHRTMAGQVRVRKDFRKPATAAIIASEMMQVVSNLLLNAFEAMSDSGGELRIRVRTVRDFVHVTISDNGAGMSSETLSGLYQRYHTTKTEGTGLGLWLSKGIVKKHNGRMNVRSSQVPGRKGTTFRISLPVKMVA